MQLPFHFFKRLARPKVADVKIRWDIFDKYGELFCYLEITRKTFQKTCY